MTKTNALRLLFASATALSSIVVMTVPASAQTTVSSIRGRVTDSAGAPVPGATVTLSSAGTGRTQTATSGANGTYILNGVRAGTYRIAVTGSDKGAFEQDIAVGVGQAATVDARLGTPATDTAAATPDDGAGSQIVVTGSRLRETRTSEIATNISQEQIRVLPQTDRNFLSFAALAPGVRYKDSETDKGFSSGASPASQVNVFIDGVSLKNKLREGGVAGQQNSRGNPFGQLAVQEFRVITQNYKAEYEQAGAAVITAITKSGTNEFHGEVFGQYTDRSLTQKSFIDKRDGNPEPAFERKQYGASLGGPIIKDKLFFFMAYEGNDQDRAFNVKSNGSDEAIDEFEQYSGRQISDFEGAFVSPFRSDFYFGKLTLTPNENQTFDVSFSRREETDIQGFQNNVSYEYAENKINVVDTYQFKWTYDDDSVVNEFSANYLNYKFNPVAINPDLPAYDYQGVILFGGKDSTRREVQQSYNFRNDLTYTGFSGHAIKFGARIEFTDISFDNQAYIQPRYYFRREPNNNLNFAFPAEARLGLGSGLLQSSNTQLGFYIQDDWDVTDKLQLNLGLRWDYESNGFNNKYRTPAAAAAALRALPTTSYFNPDDYITDGNDRSPFKGAFAPRLGFSWDIKGDRSTVVFGGAGRYYDRNNFNNTVDELSRTINPVGLFRFSADGLPRDGQPTVAWDPAYLTRDGLLALVNANPEVGLPELFAVKNNAKPPVNDQFSLGVRQRIGIFETSVTASYQRGRNGYTNLFATRKNDGFGGCCDGELLDAVRAAGYSNVLIGYDGLDTRYKALYFTLDKNYTKQSGWGLNIAYTLSKSEKNGGDLFSLDAPTPDSYGWRNSPGDERHRLVISGIVDLPLGFQFSTLTTLGSGEAYAVTDGTNGASSGLNDFTARYPKKNCIGGVFAFCEVNMTLAKTFPLFGKDDQVNVAIDLLNAFNNKNFSGFDGFFNNSLNSAGQITDPLDPADGRYAANLMTLPRRVQFRVGYRF